MRTQVNHGDDDIVENADGVVVGMTGPDLGCLSCRMDVRTVWHRGKFYMMLAAVCPECSETLAEEQEDR